MEHASIIELLNETEAAEILRVRTKTLQAWRIRGGGPVFTKIGRLVFYTPGSISDFVDRGARRSTSEKAER